MTNRSKIIRWWDTDHPTNQTGGNTNMYHITSSYVSHSHRFNCEQRCFNVDFNNIDENLTFSHAQRKISQLFIDLHIKFIELMGEKDYIRVTFLHDDFDRPVGYPFMDKKTFLNSNLMHTFESVIQSYREIKVNSNNSLKCMVVIARLPSGSGMNSNFESLNDYFHNDTNIVTIVNDDNYCLVRAVIIGVEHHRNKELFEKLLKRKNNVESAILKEKVLRLVKKLRIPNQRLGITELKKLEVYYKDYQITLMNAKSKFDRKPLFIGEKNKYHIYIAYTGSHYNVIKKMNRFHKRTYFCHQCKKAYNNIRSHKCEHLCIMCNRIECNKKKLIKCIYCNLMCKNDDCLSLHYHEFCKVANKCDICQKFKHHKNVHVCLFEKFCRNCNMAVDLDHQCYVLTEEEKKRKNIEKIEGYIWFDYETYQENNIQVANLIVAEKSCLNCIDGCNPCKVNCNLHVFRSNKQFCEWLFSGENNGYTAIAHNFQGFDGLFIMQYIKSNMLPSDNLPELIMCGTKLLTLKFRKIRMIDSFSFIPMALEKFTKTFGLKELKKGYWCHLFNHPENQNYIGMIPAKKYYTPQYFNVSKRADFDLWYDEQKDKIFNFNHELTQYCISDVKLLKEGTLSFRRNILNITKETIDPFHRCITIASLCHLVYRSMLMEPKSIGVIPLNGFNPSENSSHVALQWIKYQSFIENQYIQHSRNGGEIKFGKYSVDGYCKNTKTVYEFNGCYWHGCQKCFNSSSFNHLKKEYCSSSFKKTNDRLLELKYMLPDHKFVVMWECEFNEKKKKSLELKNFLETKCDISERLNPRDGLFGGRTNSIKLYHKCSYNEKIKYYDFTSLYPYVQKYCRYPVGQPKVITENFADISSYFGMVKCIIIPPRNLFFPVLPLKIKGKLFFTLCKTCAENKNQLCTHNESERQITGTWVTLEVKEAIKQGYKIKKIYEIWHYENTSMYDKKTKTGGLFTSYVNMFLKYKQESSGFPPNIISYEEKKQYVDNYYEKEGVDLNVDNIEKNPGLRSVMKLMLNSFWGRFGMSTNKNQVKFINEMHEWTKLISDKQNVINDIDFSIPDMLTVFYKQNDNFFDGGNSNTQINIVIAAFVTCHARLKLLSELELLGERALYHDTDSIIFLETGNKTEYVPKLGDYLGELTNELSMEQGNIIEFIGKAPKDYGYKTENGDSKCTIKGFCLNTGTDHVLNFENMKNIVLNEREKILKVEQLKFTRNKSEYTINTSVIEKLYSFTYDKRIIQDNLMTLPYGY